MAKSRVKDAQQGVALLKAYRSVFDTPQGRVVLYDLMKNHSVLSSTFRGDVNQMLVKEGERNTILRILTILKTDPKQILERIEEHEREMA